MSHIVIADDSSTARMFIRRCFEIAGFSEAEFSEVSNGQEALDLLKKKPADLVATDLNMPVLNGIDLLRHIKASPRLNMIPVIVISSAANPEMNQQLKELGAFAILSKPISPSTVAPAVSSLLEKEAD